MDFAPSVTFRVGIEVKEGGLSKSAFDHRFVSLVSWYLVISKIHIYAWLASRVVPGKKYIVIGINTPFLPMSMNSKHIPKILIWPALWKLLPGSFKHAFSICRVGIKHANGIRLDDDPLGLQGMTKSSNFHTQRLQLPPWKNVAWRTGCDFPTFLTLHYKVSPSLIGCCYAIAYQLFDDLPHWNVLCILFRI